VLPTRRCAVIIDEAHRSQSGETATDWKKVLGGAALREEAARYAIEEGVAVLEGLFRSMAKRGRQANLSFFAFTATPKHKTLAVFGREGDGKPGQPFHRYTMRQAIEEGFIMDVLQHYTTYTAYYKLVKRPHATTVVCAIGSAASLWDAVGERWPCTWEGFVSRAGIVMGLPTQANGKPQMSGPGGGPTSLGKSLGGNPAF
jgi:hypothetical protein